MKISLKHLYSHVYLIYHHKTWKIYLLTTSISYSKHLNHVILHSNKFTQTRNRIHRCVTNFNSLSFAVVKYVTRKYLSSFWADWCKIRSISLVFFKGKELACYLLFIRNILVNLMGDFSAGAPLQTVSQDWLRQANTFSLFWRAPVQELGQCLRRLRRRN